MKTETISGISQENFNIMHQAMRETVTKGTAQSLNVPYVHAAAKTGTAQTGISNRSMNSWVTGFWPVENPQYAFVVVMENASSTNQMGASGTMRKVFDYIETNSPEYFEVE
jgi:peptidoglycan glycosyltransferase